MPWNGGPLVIAEPVLVDGEVRGAVVTVSPTDGAARARAADVGADRGGGAAGARAGRARLPAGGALDPAPGAPARRGHRPGRRRRPRGRRGRARGRRQRAAGAAPALRVVRPDGRDGDRCARRAARVRRRREPPAAQPADRAAAAAVEPERARRRRARPTTTAPRWRRPSGSPSCSTDCSRWPGPSARRRWSTSTSTPRWPTGSRPGGRWPSTPGCAWSCAGQPGLTAAAPVGAVETVLDAVLDNAVKFSAPGDVITVHTARRRRPGGDRRARHRPGAGARRAGAGHGPVLAQPVAEQRRGFGAGPGHRGADRRAGRRVAAAGVARRRRAAGGGAAAGSAGQDTAATADR